MHLITMCLHSSLCDLHGAQYVKSSIVVVSVLYTIHMCIENLYLWKHKNGKSFQHLKSKFSWISDTILKAGVFVGPEVRELIKKFLIKQRLDHFRINTTVCAHTKKLTTISKSPKIFFLLIKLWNATSPLNCIFFWTSSFCLQNFGAVSGEYDARFFQDVLCIERRCL